MGSITGGVGTIIYESTNHHIEPAFQCNIVVDFQWMPQTLSRSIEMYRFVSLLKPVHFLLVIIYDNQNYYMNIIFAQCFV